MAQKRRPGRDPEEVKTKKIHVVEVDSMVQTQENAKTQSDATHSSTEEVKTNTSTNSNANMNASANFNANSNSSENLNETSKIEIQFPGSEVIRSKFPKTFEVAETVATDWMKDGNFEKVEVGPPIATEALKQGLRKAKEIEKKIMSSPVTEKVTMQAFTYAMKAQGFVNELKTKLQKK